MTDRTIEDGLAANVIALRCTLARALQDVKIACKDLENDRPRAAVGAIVPIAQAIKDAEALYRAIMILNRDLDGGC